MFAPQLFTLWNVGESGHPRWRTADPEDDTTEEFTRCKIEACSRSLDDSDADDDGATNYCTLKMMFCGPADGCKPVMHSFNLVGSEATEPSELRRLEWPLLEESPAMSSRMSSFSLQSDPKLVRGCHPYNSTVTVARRL